MKTTTTQYDGYDIPTLIAIRRDIDANIDSLRWAGSGSGLTEEVAVANRRELYRQQTAINAAITRKAK